MRSPVPPSRGGEQEVSRIVGTWRALTRTEDLIGLFAGVQTFLLLVRYDRTDVLFWWDPQAWPYVLFLWIRDLGLGLAAFFLARRLLRVALAIRPPGQGPSRRLSPTAGLVALALMCTGVALRWILPDRIPPGVWVDWILDSQAILRQPHGLPWFGGVPFGPHNHAFTSYLYLHYCGALFGIFGRGDTGFLALSAVAGCLMLPAMGWLTKEVAGWRCGVAAVGLAAFSQWPLILSRWGWIGTFLVTLLLLTAAAALAAIRTGRMSYAVLSGLAAGLTTHTHPAAAPALAGLGLFGLWSLRRPGRRPLVAAALLAALVAVAPVAVFFLQNPRNLGGRPRDVSVYVTVANSPGGPLQKARVLTTALLSNAVLYTGIPLWTTDPNPRHALPGHVLLNPLLGLGALVGLALSLERARSGSEAHVLLLLLALGTLLAGILSNPGGAPNTLRACGFLGPLFVWCCLGIDRGIEWLSTRLNARAGLLWALALASVLGVDARVLLNRWPEDRRVKAAFCYSETAAGRLRRQLADREMILDRSIIREPLVVEALAGGRDPSKPILRIPYETVDEVLTRRPSASFWMVTDSRGLAAFQQAGWRCSRGVALSTEFPEVEIALVRPAVAPDGAAALPVPGADPPESRKTWHARPKPSRINSVATIAAIQTAVRDFAASGRWRV